MLSTVNCALIYQAGVQSGSEVVTTSKKKNYCRDGWYNREGPTSIYAVRTQKMTKVLTCFKHAVTAVEEPFKRFGQYHLEEAFEEGKSTRKGSITAHLGWISVGCVYSLIHNHISECAFSQSFWFYHVKVCAV